ncbi:ATP-binding protein [Marinifilum sp. D737]|uniref:ATP-binding protein n=1 Tax=Marinifilum sp. D737 TaxID=2969628 RepID=UPI0022732DC3|nr:transporter substrate-binding domain-containing protein [Marinifilum sp. D737]MCY1634106.1 ATP-binding protein [Marinifilum sp. D737]
MKYVFQLISIIFLFGCSNEKIASFLNKDEQKWLLENGDSIRVVQDPLFAPLDFLNSKDEVVGISDDYLDLIEKKLNIKFIRTHRNSLEENLNFIKNKKVEIATSIAKTPQRSKYLLFTEPYYKSPAVIISNKSKKLAINDLLGKKVGVSNMFAVHEYLVKNYPELDLDVVPDDLTGLKKLVFNETDVMVVDLGSASFHLENLGIVKLHVAGNVGFTYEIAMGVRDDMPILRDILNKTIRSIDRAEKNKIRKDWVFLSTREFWERKNFWYWSSAIILVFLIVFSVVLFFNRRLQKLVKRSTSELNKELKQRLIAENSLRESEEKYRIVAEQKGQIVYDYNLLNDRIYWSGDLERTIGLTPKEYESVTIKDWESLVHPDDVTEAKKMLEQSIANGENYDVIYRYKRKDGSYVPINDKGTFLKDKDNKAYRMLGIMNDISMQIEREEQLKEAIKIAENADHLKTQFLANMSHEIRTPMNSIVGFSSLLTMPNITRDKQLKYSDFIQQSSDYLQKIIDDIMDISMIESEQINLYNEEVNVKKLIETLKEFFENHDKITNESIELSTQIDLDEVNENLYTDEVRLKQILINLVGNACKYTDKGSVRIHCSKRDHTSLLFEVKDTGVGIPEDQIENIFDRFLQVKNQGMENNSGTGLGLSISKGLVELLGGEIWCESAVGVGTSFYFTLPIRVFSSKRR